MFIQALVYFQDHDNMFQNKKQRHARVTKTSKNIEDICDTSLDGGGKLCAR